jgi:hypothetical protein
MSRIDDALRYLAEQISVTKEEFWRGNQPGGAALLEGITSHGYTLRKGDRFALSPAGHRRLKAIEPSPDAVDAP